MGYDQGQQKRSYFQIKVGKREAALKMTQFSIWEIGEW